MYLRILLMASLVEMRMHLTAGRNVYGLFNLVFGIYCKVSPTKTTDFFLRKYEFILKTVPLLF